MTFDKLFLLVEDAYIPAWPPNIKPVEMDLKIGKYDVYFGEGPLPTYIYPYDEAIKNPKIISKITQGNIDRIATFYGQPVAVDKVYKADRSNRGAYSTFVSGTLDSKPFIFARVETWAKGAGRTYFYTETSKQEFFKLTKITKEGNIYKTTQMDGEVLYSLDRDHKILHNLMGPAVIYTSIYCPSEFWVDGKRVSGEQWAIFSKYKKEEDRQHASNILNTLD